MGSFYGTYVIARCDALLPHSPEVQSAFGTQVMRSFRRDDGWQLVELLAPFAHQWPTVGAGPAPLAEATGTPVLAVWVSESACLQYAAATPDGWSWTAHFSNEANNDVEEFLAVGQLPEGRCGFDHHMFCTLRLPEGVDVPPDDQVALAGNLLEWAAAGGLDTTAERIIEALGATTNETAVFALVEALGLEPLKAVEPLFDFYQPDWWDVYRRGEDESARVCRAWTRSGHVPAYDQPPPGAAEFVRFLDLVTASRFGGGLTRAQLQAEAQRLVDAYPDAEEVDPIVLAEVRLQPHHQPTGVTRHNLGAPGGTRAEFPRPKSLQVVQYPGDEPRVYLFYCDESGEEMTDTYHDSVGDAFGQASAEFGVLHHEWARRSLNA